MCYSALVKQDLKAVARQVRARIDYPAWEELLERRADDEAIKVVKALEANFNEPTSPDERRISAAIARHHAKLRKQWEASFFAQRKRLADAERFLASKETKRALDERRIATTKIAWLREKLADLDRKGFKEEDAQIFPFWYAPITVSEGGEYVIKPMRYHCRPRGKPESHDKRFDGLYNARRDSLEGFWKNLFGKQHGIVIATGFYENVALHEFERRALREGESPTNVILHFNPRPGTEMLLACLWDRWSAPGKQDLYSFAAITDEPPPEVAATGHNRCVIPLKPANIAAWLNPAGMSRPELYAILEDRERPHYEHRLAA